MVKPFMDSASDEVKGMVVAVVSSLVTAVLFAYFFRLPIPMGGLIGPFGELSIYDINPLKVLFMVFVAWVFYNILGGLIIVVLCGAMTGKMIGNRYSVSNNKNKMIILWSSIAGAIPVFLLSILDYIIGPW